MSKHTPGPWWAGTDEDARLIAKLRRAEAAVAKAEKDIDCELAAKRDEYADALRKIKALAEGARREHGPASLIADAQAALREIADAASQALAAGRVN